MYTNKNNKQYSNKSEIKNRPPLLNERNIAINRTKSQQEDSIKNRNHERKRTSILPQSHQNLTNQEVQPRISATNHRQQKGSDQQIQDVRTNHKDINQNIDNQTPNSDIIPIQYQNVINHQGNTMVHKPPNYNCNYGNSGHIQNQYMPMARIPPWIYHSAVNNQNPVHNQNPVQHQHILFNQVGAMHGFPMIDSRMMQNHVTPPIIQFDMQKPTIHNEAMVSLPNSMFF